MRYLIKFNESIKNENSSISNKISSFVLDASKLAKHCNEFYRRISIDEYRDGIPFDINYYDMVSKIREVLPSVEFISYNHELSKISFKYDNRIFNISFFGDEWFKVSFSDRGSLIYYECDQFEGLTKLLNDIGLTSGINESKLDKPNIKRFEIDGFVVIQGKDAKSNDYVTLELASDDDYWMHAKGVPGSHVIIKVKDRLPTSDVIKKVAIIAAKNSKSKEEEVLIVYCKRKFVKKERGMNVGQVIVDYKNAYEIKVPKK
jgi:hypothetical protein